MKRSILIGAAIAVLLVSCTRTEVGETTRVQVPLSFVLSENARPATKTLDEMAQSGSAEGTFRGITEISFLPFDVQRAVQAEDDRMEDYCDPLADISLYYSNHSVLYEKLSLPRNAASFLFYGKANTEDVTDIWKTGSLQVTGLNGAKPAEIRFAPHQIAPDATDNSKRDKLANYLTNIANAKVTQVAGIATFADSYPKEFAQFTNEGQLMAGTSTAIKQRLDVLYKDINNKAASDIKTKILNAILSNDVSRDAQTGIRLPATMSPYPASNLPSGAAAMRWNGSKFVLGDDASLYMPAYTRYCYPIPLWYYANTTICTTEKKENTYSALSALYTSAGTSWNDILDVYEKNPGIIRPETKGAALVNPVQYGVAQLSLTLEKVSSSKLVDADGKTFDVNNDKFPVTALIVGGQRIQDFNFTPLTGSEDYLVYDYQYTEKAYLSSTQPEATLRCLVLESALNAPVYLAMELQNNSSKAIKGATGWVLVGAKFYLTGRLDLSDADNPGNGKIFERGCVTTAKVFVSSLKKAYNVIPDLRDPQLQVAFTVDLDWDFNTPINSPLK